MKFTEAAIEAAAQALWQVQPLTRENVRAAARRVLEAASPRTITTVEERDALREGSVVRDKDGDVIERLWGGWYFGDNNTVPNLPATVLHEPKAAYHSEGSGGACDGCGFLAPNGGWYPGPCPPEYASQQLEWSESGVPKAEATR